MLGVLSYIVTYFFKLIQARQEAATLSYRALIIV